MEGVYRFLLTPRWWGINVFVLLAIPFCVFMGSWQLSRFEDRVQDHRTATEEVSRREGEGRPAAAELLPVDKKTSGDRVTASGRYGKQLLVPGRQLDDRSGYYVLTLLRTDGGKALPVVRGWLPGTADAAKAPAPPAGEVTVTGALQASETPGSNGVSAAGRSPGRADRRDQRGLAGEPRAVRPVRRLGHPRQGRLGDEGVPATAPADTGLDLKAFQNLGYTGEWFVFAGFVVFMWFRLLRREAEFARDAELGLTPCRQTPSGTARRHALRAKPRGKAPPPDPGRDGIGGTTSAAPTTPAASSFSRPGGSCGADSSASTSSATPPSLSGLVTM